MFTISQYFYHLSNTKVLLEKAEYLCYNALLLFGTVATAEACHRRHKLINIRSGSLDSSVAECGFDELARLLFFEVFFGDYLFDKF